MKILLSIKPKYSEKIFSGEKRYEFRKQTPKKKIEKVYVYESNPIQHIVGWFTIKKILTGTPEEIWAKCSSRGGIDHGNFMAYCADKTTIHALAIDEYDQFQTPIDPYAICPDYKPPQNYAYFDNSELFRKLESSTGSFQTTLPE
ncbi:MAG: ASCH domain-containing protein [Candidatus Altiarchaeota archaeon]|nr:ASCH domain-containing protein [Candidatus Altiarchaeota archaeon]